MLMPIGKQKKSLWDATAAKVSGRPMSHATQRNARSHGSARPRLAFQKRAMTASTPIMTNGDAATIANTPINMSFASGFIFNTLCRDTANLIYYGDYNN